MGPCLGREHSGNSIPATPLSSVKCPASSTSHPFFPSVAVQSLPTRTTQYARNSVNDSHTLYPQALLIPSRISLARPVQQKTTKSLEGRGPHSSCFSPLRMAHKGPDAMALKQVFNTVYFKLASCPTQSTGSACKVVCMRTYTCVGCSHAQCVVSLLHASVHDVLYLRGGILITLDLVVRMR